MKIAFTGTPPVSAEGMRKNFEHCHSLGVPVIQKQEVHDRPLAIVGGGPSIVDEVETLKAWKGDIFAVNGACGWLRERGVDSTFFSVDPCPIVGDWAQGATKALVVSRCDPIAFEVLKDADVKVFDLIQDREGGMICGTSTATAAFNVAAELGYRDVTFFGCESCYGEKSHAYQHEERDHRLLVKCGELEYHTAPDFYVQAQELSTVIKMFRSHFKERSGGLLRAMIENEDHDITKISRSLRDELTPVLEAA